MVGASDSTPPDKPSKSNVIKYSSAKVGDKTSSQPARSGLKDPIAIDKLHPKVRRVPDTNFTLATLVCLCFNLPLGAIAMYLSLTAARAYRDGKNEKGDVRANWSVMLSLFSIVSTVLIVMSIVLWIVVEAQSTRELRDNS